MRRLLKTFSAFLFKIICKMENKIIVIEKRFDRFDLLYFETNDSIRVNKITDLIYSIGKEDFKNKIKNIPKIRLDYLNLWREFSKKEIIYAYDSIIENHLEIEKEIQYANEETCFIIRRNDFKLNHLNKVDLEIELTRASKKNWHFIKNKFEELDWKMDKKFDILENVLRVKQFELKFKNSLNN